MKVGSAVDDWESIPLSRIAQAGYCLRRAALLTNEQLWQENADTAKGREAHTRVHINRIERRGEHLQLFEYDVFSEKLNIAGKCDCVEAERNESGCIIPAAEFPVRLYPIEYKSGKLRDEEEYELQLCAQAMCLEEMYQITISEGAIFYIGSHRRKAVVFTQKLRNQVLETICKLEDIRRRLLIPPAVPDPKCKRCSIRELCLPNVVSSAKRYCNMLAKEAMEMEVESS